MLKIAITNQQQVLEVDEQRARAAIRLIFSDAKITSADLSLAIVDDPTIHELNQKFLQHDYPTDVLSFLLDRSGDRLEGEVIVSADTALASAETYGWSAGEELLLYVIHGTLHLVGYDDKDSTDERVMRNRESEVLAHFGLPPRNQSADAGSVASSLASIATNKPSRISRETEGDPRT